MARAVVVAVLMVGLAGLMTSALPSLPIGSASAELLTLAQDYWDWKTHEFPFFSTMLGLNDDTAARLDSYDKQRLQQRKVKCEEFLQRANKIDAALLSPEDVVTLKVFKEEINTYVQNFPYKKYYVPVTFLSGPQGSLKYLLEKLVILNSYNDYEKLLSRYGDFPRQAQEILTLLWENLKDNIRPSNWSMVGVVDRFDKLIVPVNETLFYQPFINMSANITAKQRTTLRQQAQTKIKMDLLPCLKEIRNFIANDYLPATRTEVGVSSLPGGKAYYQACLKFHTTTDLTPQEIHDLGLKEVARIEAEVQKTAAEIGMKGKTFSEITQALKTDPAQRFSSKKELLETFRNTIYNDIYPRVKMMFPDLPQDNVTVQGDDNPDALFAVYSDPSIDGSRLGTFTLNTHSHESWKRYEVMALSLHETYPGHHLEAINTKLNPSIPIFRKFVDYTSGTNAPARFPLRTAMTEGWGLYSEFLGEELGLYTDPYQRMGRHSYELLRASRLVVDTGLHALGWSRDRAVAFLLDHTAMTESNIQGEVNRYITYPGQACSYKVGEIKIKELRQRAQKALGISFQLEDFHNVLLGCFASLNIVEECVTTYIGSASQCPA